VFFFVGSLKGIFIEQKLLFPLNYQNFINYNVDVKIKFCNTELLISFIRLLLMFSFYLLVNSFVLNGIGGDPKLIHLSTLLFLDSLFHI
jgi:hypothetical protein